MIKKLIAALLILACCLTLFPVTASAATGSKLIALTFDDGPGSYTARLLDGLATRGVKVTFFLQGRSASNYPNTVRRMYNEGHQVASHTYNHPALTTLSNAEIASQLNRTTNILNEILGVNATYLLRPPYGDYNTRVMNAIGCPAIFWSLDPADWQDRNATTVCNRIVGSAFDGVIVLAHDIHSTTVTGALNAIDKLLAQGYEFVTVNELFRRRGVELKNGNRYYSCKPNGIDYGAVATPRLTLTPIYGDTLAYLSSTAGAKIYYTTDGTQPTENSKVYTGPFSVKAGQTICAIAAFNFNGDRSSMLKQKIDVVPLLDPVVSKGENGVIITNPNPNSQIRYTTDGKASSGTSACYNAPIPYFDGVLHYRAMGSGSASGDKAITVSARGNLYWDMQPGNWYFDPMDRAVSLGLVSGVGEFRMAPGTAVTRAMFVTLLYRLVSMETREELQVETESFPDVLEGTWYTEAVAWAADAEIVNGYGDGKFHPNDTITREQMCAAMYRFLQWKGVKPLEEQTLEFADEQIISSWAREGVTQTTAMGLVKGVGGGRFAPKQTSSRAEAAALLIRLHDFLAEYTWEEPTEPTEPETEPTEPATEPTEESEPSEPTEPGEPTQDSEPTEPTEETEPTEPTEGDEQ